MNGTESPQYRVFALYNAATKSAQTDETLEKLWNDSVSHLYGKPDITSVESARVNVGNPDIAHHSLATFLCRDDQSSPVIGIAGGAGTTARVLSVIPQLTDGKDVGPVRIMYFPTGKDTYRTLPYSIALKDKHTFYNTLSTGADIQISCMQATVNSVNQPYPVHIRALRSIGLNTPTAKMIRRLPWETSLVRQFGIVLDAARGKDTAQVHISSEEQDIYEGAVVAVEVFNIKRSLYDRQALTTPPQSQVQLLAIPAVSANVAGVARIGMGLAWENFLARTAIPASRRINPFLIKDASDNFTILSPAGTLYEYDGMEEADRLLGSGDYRYTDKTQKLDRVERIQITGCSQGVIFRVPNGNNH